MELKIFQTGPFQVNTYLVYDNKSKEGIIIDVGGSVDEIIQEGHNKSTTKHLGMTTAWALVSSSRLHLTLYWKNYAPGIFCSMPFTFCPGASPLLQTLAGSASIHGDYRLKGK